ncbi:hypothetical protein [Yoonia sp.]|uniref:hypothetical protein n=1 Tax=Yoonia sp. TaxID=2212373 RepID=UPI0025FAF837|nr:hypothetical protein [Yoonia sp.]
MPAADFTVAIHIGAHKTATSHLQRSLHSHVDALSDAGVRYYGPEHLRLPGRSLPTLFGLKVGRATDTQRRAPADQLALLRKGAARLVLSEENYIGGLNSPRGRPVKTRYPQAASRLSALAAGVDCGGLDVFLSIRHPASFLNSAYGQLLLGGRVMPMAQFTQLNPIASVNWLDLVLRIRRAAGVNRLTVWQYEDYQDIFPQIIGGLAGPQNVPLVAPLGRKIHVGLSAAAVAQVQQGAGAAAVQNVAVAARKSLPVTPEHVAFDGFTPAQHDTASQLYKAQIAGIAALNGVTFLRP